MGSPGEVDPHRSRKKASSQAHYPNTIDFLRAVFIDCSDSVEFRPIPPNLQSVFTRDPTEVHLLLEQCKARSVNVFYGVATREGGGTKSHCREVPAVWIDVDFKDLPEHEAEERLTCFPLKPSAIIESGGGLHWYWFLKNPLDARTEGERVEAVLRHLAERLGGDRGACDVSRVLRLPGTLNFKYTPPRECRVREVRADRRYDFAELEGLFPSESLHAPGGTSTITEIEGGVPQGKRNSTLARLAGKKFSEGWSPHDVLLWAVGWNRQHCNPPLPEGEVLATVGSIQKTHERNHQGRKSYTDISDVPPIWDLEAKLDWIVEDFIASGSVTLVSSESGTGKTWLALAIAAAVASGKQFAGRQVQQRPVLYLDGENPLFTIKERLSELGVPRNPSLVVWGGWVDPPAPPPHDPTVVRFAREHHGLVIVDPLVGFHTGSEQDATETRAFMRHIRNLANLGAAVLVLHHSGKADTAKLYRGSSDIKASVDQAYHLRAVPENADRLEKLFLQCFKGRLVPEQSFGVRFEAGVGFLQSDLSSGSLTRSSHAIIEEILGARPGSNQTEVVELAREKGLSKHQAEAALKSGPWRTEPGRGREILYYVQEDDAEFESVEI